MRDFVNEVKAWIEEGYVDSAVWKRFQNFISLDVLPTFSETSQLSSESPASGLVLEDVEPVHQASPSKYESTRPEANAFSRCYPGIKFY